MKAIRLRLPERRGVRSGSTLDQLGRLYNEAGGLPAMLEAVRFLWNATRGSRLRPWRSAYLRWRYETYTGKPAKEVGLRDFWYLVCSERRQFMRFIVWVVEMKGYAATAE